MKKSPVSKGYGYDTLQPGQVLSSSHFCHQAPPRIKRCQRSQRRKMELFVEKAVQYNNIISMSSSISSRRFVARNIHMNGEEAVVSAKLRVKLSTNSSTIFSSELLQLVEVTFYSLIPYTLAACRAHICFESFINTIDTCRASEIYLLIWLK